MLFLPYPVSSLAPSKDIPSIRDPSPVTPGHPLWPGSFPPIAGYGFKSLSH